MVDPNHQLRTNRVAVLQGDLFHAIREEERKEREDWHIDEKKDGPIYRDEAWHVSFHWLDGQQEDIMFSGSTFDVPLAVVPEEHRNRLRRLGLIVESALSDGEQFASEPDHLAQIPQYILDRVVGEGYRIYSRADPYRCPECGADRYVARFEQPDVPAGHVVLSRWQCMGCSAPIAFDRPESPAYPRDPEASTADVYGETKDNYRYTAHCSACDAERMIFETVSTDADVCLTCGASVVDGGEADG